MEEELGAAMVNGAMKRNSAAWRTARIRRNSALSEPGFHHGASECWMRVEKEEKSNAGSELSGERRQSDGA